MVRSFLGIADFLALLCFSNGSLAEIAYSGSSLGVESRPRPWCVALRTEGSAYPSVLLIAVSFTLDPIRGAVVWLNGAEMQLNFSLRDGAGIHSEQSSLNRLRVNLRKVRIAVARRDNDVKYNWNCLDPEECLPCADEGFAIQRRVNVHRGACSASGQDEHRDDQNGALHRSNETELSHRWRERASLRSLML